MIIKYNNKIVTKSHKWCSSTGATPVPPGPGPAPGPGYEVLYYTYGQGWLRNNLHEDDGGEGIIRIDNVSNNGVNFGTQYYYTIDAAKRIANSWSQWGWRLPSIDDWLQFIEHVSSNPADYKSNSGWNGSYNGNCRPGWGFEAFPVGLIYKDSTDTLSRIGWETAFWSSTQDVITNDYYTLGLSDNTSFKEWTYEIGDYISVRLVRDI